MTTDNAAVAARLLEIREALEAKVWPTAVEAAVSRAAWSETELAHSVDGAAVHRLLLRKPE